MNHQWSTAWESPTESSGPIDWDGCSGKSRRSSLDSWLEKCPSTSGTTNIRNAQRPSEPLSLLRWDDRCLFWFEPPLKGHTFLSFSSSLFVTQQQIGQELSFTYEVWETSGADEVDVHQSCPAVEVVTQLFYSSTTKRFRLWNVLKCGRLYSGCPKLT